MSMAYADDLLEQARALAAADPHRPKQANVRRAVSAAYYALFHEVVEKSAASVLAGAESSSLIGSRVRRTVQHNSALKAAKWFAGAASMPVAIQRMRTPQQVVLNPDFARFCQTFAELQEDRHRADYDLTSPFSRAEANRRISDASAAIDTLRALPPKGDVLIFLLGCLLGDSMTRNA